MLLRRGVTRTPLAHINSRAPGLPMWITELRKEFHTMNRGAVCAVWRHGIMRAICSMKMWHWAWGETGPIGSDEYPVGSEQALRAYWPQG